MEIINLDMVPGKKSPVCHASQFDEGRAIRFNLYDSGLPFTLDGTESITFEVRKPDGNIVISTLTNTSDSYVDVVTTEQMTAVKGANLCEVRIEKGETNIGSLNVIMAVEMDPTDGGIESASEIDNLRSQVNEMVAEEVAEQYDSANVIFDTEPTEGHGTGYTVTSEGIKTAINNAFDYDNTASGSLVHITDGADNIPVKSLVSEIVAIESGSGEKSPDNPYSISGFDSGVVPVCGVNLWDEVFETGDISFATGGNITGASWIRSTNYVPIVSGLTIYVKSAQIINIFFYDYNKAYLGNNSEGLKSNVNNTEITISSKARYFRIATNQTSYNHDISINYPSTDTQYHAYNGNTYTFTFGQTVYGGHFDNKGNLANNRGELVLSSLNWYYSSNGYFEASINIDCPTVTQWVGQNGNCGIYTIVGMRYVTNSADRVNNSIAWYSNVIRVADNSTTDVSTFVTKLQNQSVYYELANPITLAITSQDIPTLLGENNIFSNCGDVEVNYYTNKSNDILEFIDSEIGKKNGTNIPIEEDSQDSIKDYVDDEISTINTSLSNKANKTEDTTITVASGYTLISSCCGKTDRLIHLNFNVEKTGGFATGWQVIGTTDFKPNTLVYCPLWNVTNGLANGEVRIDTDGTINFYVVTAGELRLNANIGYVTD